MVAVCHAAGHVTVFRYQKLLEGVMRGVYRPAPPDPLADIYEVLTQTELVSLPIFMLGVSPRECLIATRLKDENCLEGIPEARYALACQALAERRYTEAVEYLSPVVDKLDQGSHAIARIVYNFALRMADRSD